MTSQPRTRPRHTHRVPTTTIIGIGLAAIAGFAGGAFAFRSDGEPATPETELASLAANLPASPGVANISDDEWTAIQRQVHDAFIDAYLATWPGGFPQALPVPPVASVAAESSGNLSPEEARAEHDALIDGIPGGTIN